MIPLSSAIFRTVPYAALGYGGGTLQHTHSRRDARPVQIRRLAHRTERRETGRGVTGRNRMHSRVSPLHAKGCVAQLHETLGDTALRSWTGCTAGDRPLHARERDTALCVASDNFTGRESQQALTPALYETSEHSASRRNTSGDCTTRNDDHHSGQKPTLQLGGGNLSVRGGTADRAALPCGAARSGRGITASRIPAR